MEGLPKGSSGKARDRNAVAEAVMKLETRIFELCPAKCRNLSDLARAMGISVSQIYRVREGKRRINQKFITGAIKAFPELKLDDLFYLAPESPTVTNNYQLLGSARHK